MPRRATRPASLATLLTRLEGLEQRLLQLETGRVGPGDGRASVERPARPVRRCPGCGLPLRKLKGRCAACKRPLDSI